MKDGVRRLRREGRGQVWCAVIDGEIYSAWDLAAKTGYHVKTALERIRLVRQNELPLRALLEPKPAPDRDSLAARHMVTKRLPDGRVRRGLGIVIDGEAWLVPDIVARTGLAHNSVRARLEAVFAGRLDPRRLLDPAVDGRATTLRRGHYRRACCEYFDELERLAFCRPWA